MKLLFIAIVDFYVFYDGAVDMQNMSPSDKKSLWSL